MTRGGNQPKKPESVAGYHVGDRVLTPLGRTARITAFRQDGLLDAEYEGWHSRDGSVILQPSLLKRVQ